MMTIGFGDQYIITTVGGQTCLTTPEGFIHKVENLVDEAYVDYGQISDDSKKFEFTWQQPAFEAFRIGWSTYSSVEYEAQISFFDQKLIICPIDAHVPALNVIVSGETISFDAAQYLLEPWNSLELADMTGCNLISFSIFLDAEGNQPLLATDRVAT